MNDQSNTVSSAYNFGSDRNNCVTSDHTTACPVPQACGSRLPCGVCLITNQRCPLMPCAPSITWTSGDGLNSPQFGPTCTAQSTEQHTNTKATMSIEKE